MLVGNVLLLVCLFIHRKTNSKFHLLISPVIKLSRFRNAGCAMALETFAEISWSNTTSQHPFNIKNEIQKKTNSHTNRHIV